MDLKITSCNNFYKLKGTLNKKNISLFQDEIQDAFERFNSLTISVEGLESVDTTGVNAITSLHNQSIANNIQLAIIGTGCKELYDHFKSQENAQTAA